MHCPECLDKIELDMSFTKVAGTIAYYVMDVVCSNGHRWTSGAEMDMPTSKADIFNRIYDLKPGDANYNG